LQKNTLYYFSGEGCWLLPPLQLAINVHGYILVADKKEIKFY